MTRLATSITMDLAKYQGAAEDITHVSLNITNIAPTIGLHEFFYMILALRLPLPFSVGLNSSWCNTRTFHAHYLTSFEPLIIFKKLHLKVFHGYQIFIKFGLRHPCLLTSQENRVDSGLKRTSSIAYFGTRARRRPRPERVRQLIKHVGRWMNTFLTSTPLHKSAPPMYDECLVCGVLRRQYERSSEPELDQKERIYSTL